MRRTIGLLVTLALLMALLAVEAPSAAHQVASGSPLQAPSAQIRSRRGCKG
jgi:hypothetical protein